MYQVWMPVTLSVWELGARGFQVQSWLGQYKALYLKTKTELNTTGWVCSCV